MVKLVALYTHPDDAAEFDRRFFAEHLPLARSLPGLQHIEVSRITGTPLGPAPYYLIVEHSFVDRAALDAALASDQHARATLVLRFAAGLSTLLLAEEARIAL